MSETNIETINENMLVDLFPNLTPGEPVVQKPISFGRATNTDVDLNTVVEPPKDPETPPAEPPVDPKTEVIDDKAEVDIAGEGIVSKDDKKGTILSDLSSYYEDRIKSGKFIAIEDQDENGNPIPFIPKTAEEYDEVLELQLNYKLEQAKKDLENRWYQSKSPAWKAVSQYAELVDDPSQLIPFIQGVGVITSVANLDENTSEDAERIVRTRLAQNGDTEEIIDQQVDALKTTDKLLSTAKLYKPMIMQQEQARLQAQMVREKELEAQSQAMLADLRSAAIKSIDAPLFGKTNLKQEEKAAIYELIGEPSEETQGFAIYSMIDNLFDKKDFDTLKEIAFLLTNKESFYNYLGITIANKTASSLERKLRIAGDSRTAGAGGGFTEEIIQQPKVARDQFKKPSFGRSK